MKNSWICVLDMSACAYTDCSTLEDSSELDELSKYLVDVEITVVGSDFEKWLFYS